MVAGIREAAVCAFPAGPIIFRTGKVRLLLPHEPMNVLSALLMMAPAPGSNPLIGLLPIVAMLAIMYFLLLRPQQKEARRHQEMLKSLKKGDEVVTAGGLYGRILALNEERVSLRVDEGVKVEIERAKIQRVVSRTGAAGSDETAAEKGPERARADRKRSRAS